MECPQCQMDFRDPVTNKPQHHPWCLLRIQGELQTENSTLRARLALADKLAEAAKEFLRCVGRNINSHEDLQAYNRAHASLRETAEAYHASAGGGA